MGDSIEVALELEHFDVIRSERVDGHLEVHVRSTFRCRDCARTSRERHPCLDGQRRATERFRRQLFDEACERPFSEIAVEHE